MPQSANFGQTLDERAFIEDALEKYQRAYERDRENIEEAYEDLNFRAGKQWPEEIEKERAEEGRPCLTINRIPQFVRQVTGDIRQMRPAIRTVAIDSRGDKETAELIAGMIRYIENRSQAKTIYNRCADSQVTAGIGHWQVTTEYASQSTFNQEIRIVGIEDGVSVIWDADAVLPNREDAMFCFVPVDMSRSAFEARWPEAAAEHFRRGGEHLVAEGWYGEDYIRVAQYWLKKPAKRRLALLPDGGIDDLTDDPDAEEKAQAIMAQGGRVEFRDGFKVCRYLISGAEILEGPLEWPGRYIPVVPVIGEEVRIGRRVVRHGIVRYAKDPQRMLNYYRSAHTEVVALQPKAPFVATEDQVKRHLHKWETANQKNWAVLTYDPDPKAGAAGLNAPQRVQPPVSSQGISDGALIAADDMKAVIGIYDAGLGARSNETSGKAILARQREGDVGTFVYHDNFALAIEHTGRIIVDLIPHVYDSERMIRVVGEDGRVDMIEINRAVMVEGMERVMNDVTVGAYDVTIDIGPSYTTKREEAKEGMREFIQASPNVAPVIGDLYAEAQDWPMAEKIGKRLRALLPPQIRDAEEEGAMEQAASPPDPMTPDGVSAQASDPAAIAQAQAVAIELQKGELDLRARNRAPHEGTRAEEGGARAGAGDCRVSVTDTARLMGTSNGSLPQSFSPRPIGAVLRRNSQSGAMDFPASTRERGRKRFGPTGPTLLRSLLR